MPAGDPAALERLAAQLDAAASGTDSLASRTVRTTADIRTNADWTGTAADGYTAFTGNLTRGVGATQAPLTRIAGAVRGYADYLRTAQEKVSAYSSAAQTADATRHPADVAAAKTAEQDARSAIAAQQTAGDHAEAEVRDATGEMENPFGPDGVVREWIEKIHAPWDVLAADAPLGKLLSNAAAGEEMAKVAKEFNEGLPKLLRKSADALDASLQAADADWETNVNETLRLLDDYDAIRKWNLGQLEAGEELAKGANLLHGIAVGSDVLGIAGDAYVLAKPEDSGAMGDVDRGVAAANMGASAADGTYAVLGMLNMTTDEIPVAGEVVLVGSGLYLGGDYLYHHWQPFHDVCNDVGHATASVAKGIWHGVTSIF
jgi:uncharacterized protein YukE